MFPDVALLRIFDFYLDKARIEAWYTLVRVCQNWRNIVFGSSRRLNLQIFCRARIPLREMLDAWPPLPIIIRDPTFEKWDWDNVIAALEHNDRICEFNLSLSNYRFKTVLAAMQRPFPALKHLQLRLPDEERASRAQSRIRSNY
jgi:hypothetical protein